VSPSSPSRGLDELALKTPASRDRYVDFLRAASILVVVFGHWLSSLVSFEGGFLSVRNAVGVVPGTWLTTWVLQVMPVFFFIGGFSNAAALTSTARRGGTVGSYLRSRLVRLLKPVFVFLVAWTAILLSLRLSGAVGPQFIKSVVVLFGPLWFIVIYLVVVLLAPLTHRLHRRLGLKVPVLLALLAVALDVLRFALNLTAVAWPNIILVWVCVHQLGYFYADGSLLRGGRRLHGLLAGVGVAGLVVLTNIGVYPRSMVGTGFERISNMSPPTACILFLTLWLVGGTMLLREPLSRWLGRPGPWKSVIFANSIIMTVFLWHLPAFVFVFFLTRWAGLAGPAPGTWLWWLERPALIVASAAVLAPLVLLFARFERPGRRTGSASSQG
jgi:peptidoglycan/LPS O-acetylase OafA/YrhL